LRRPRNRRQPRGVGFLPLLVPLGLLACGQGPEPDCPTREVPILESEGPPTWERGGREARLVLDREVRLDSSADGFIMKLRHGNVVHEDGRFYVADAVRGSGVTVFDSLGGYVKTIPSVFERSPIKGLIVEGDGLWIRSDYESTIARIDTLGREVRRIETTRGLGQGQPVIIAGGFDVLRKGDRARVYTSIFEDHEPFDFGAGRWIAVYGEKDTPVALFACPAPLYRELFIPSYQFKDLSVIAGRVYVVEWALPQVRVFSLDGEPIETFAGSGGAHFHQVRNALPTGATHAQLDSLFVERSRTYAVDEIRVAGHDQPVVGVAYGHWTEEWLAVRPRSDNHSRHYLALYSTDGELLLREIPLPGRLMYVSTTGQLVVNLDDTPDRRRLGIYRIVLDAGS